MAIVSADGTVTQMIRTQPPTPVCCFFQGGAWTGTPTAVAESVPVASDPAVNASGLNPGTTHFFVGDHLGSTHMELTAGGWPVYHRQFAPFGQELQMSGTMLAADAPDGSSNNYKFTGEERDAESGLDHFNFRHYASGMGRWMSPNPSGLAAATMSNPQSLNLYTYAANNPLIFVDPTGLEYCTGWTSSENGSDSIAPTTADSCKSAGGVWNPGDPTSAQLTTTISTLDPFFDDAWSFMGTGGLTSSGGETYSPIEAPSNQSSSSVQTCLHDYGNSYFGKTVKLFSLYNLYQERKSLKTWAEWTVLPFAKVKALNFTAQASKLMSNVEFPSLTGAGAGASVEAPLAAGIDFFEGVAGAAAAPLVIGGTISDMVFTQTCKNGATFVGH